MIDLLKQYWYVAWGLFASAALIAYRLRQDREGGTLGRRLRRLINKTDPRTGRDQNEAAGRALMWLLPALAVIALFTFAVRLFTR